ncbi:hypothetical protein JKP88DRAFT_269854 [Tribonema minus]|uniref:Uncharacterized protein n=1 Tax=Tribonema minus TaxID=303371 RepID=A0A835YZ46_9STRA|nr:hypothetical protein JKP88DRAFT_269854 [Tribonema minus]
MAGGRTKVATSQPIYIVELGAGAAKLSFVLLHKLLGLRQFWPRREDGGAPFKYIITDVTDSTFQFFREHSCLRPLFESGLLDLARYNAEEGGALQLEVSGEVLQPGTLEHPVVCVANYVFDSLRQDAFRVTAGGELEELLSTVSAAAAPADVRASLAPEVLRHIKCTSGGRGGVGSGSSFLMPVGALAALRNLRALTARGQLVVLAGDKGHTQLSEMDGQRDPHIALHGSFSCMVNFYALRLFVEAAGGCALSSLLGGRFGPDGFSTLQRCLKEESKTPGLRSALAVVRLSQHDPDVFYKFKQAFIDKAPHASEKLQNDIRHDMRRVYSCYYPLLPSKDVAFELGRIYMGLKDFAQAVELFSDSQKHCGVHHVSWYNMGVCHYYLNQLDAAAHCFDESLALCPDYPDALKWRRKLKNRGKGGQMRVLKGVRPPTPRCRRRKQQLTVGERTV